MPTVQGKSILVKKFKVDLDVAWAELERIRQANGGLVSPEKIVEAATAPDSPIHGAFEWDDAKAAIGYRKVQARQLVQCFDLVFEDGSTGPAMVSVKIDNQRGYMPTMEAKVRHDLRAQMLKDALTQLIAVQNRFRTLGELDEMYAVIRETAAGLGFEELSNAAKPQRERSGG